VFSRELSSVSGYLPGGGGGGPDTVVVDSEKDSELSLLSSVTTGALAYNLCLSYNLCLKLALLCLRKLYTFFIL